MIKGYEARDDGKPWACVPREPEAFGHLIVAAGKHYVDISDEKLAGDKDQLEQIMRLINKLCLKMKKYLRFEGRICERVYVSTLCETENMHLHFHLIPRFKGDRTGFRSLFEKELDGTRWMLNERSEDQKIREGYCAVLDAGTIVDFHKHLFASNRWLRPNKDRESFIEEVKNRIEEILDKSTPYPQ